MFDDYYSFYPQLQLKKSVCVIGFFGTPLAQSVRFMQAISGLPVQDLERLLEHKLGARLEHYLQGHHKDQLQQQELNIVESVLGEQPSIIALRPSSLRSRKVRDALTTLDGVVFVQPLSVLQNQLDRIYQEDRRERFRDLDLQLPVTDTQLQAEWIVWKRYLPNHWQEIESSETAPSALGQQLWNHIQDRF